MREAMFRSLCRIRRVEEEIARIYPTNKIKSPVHLSIGQEAVSLGVCEALHPEDVVFGTYRSHALYLAKGGNLKKMIAELYGKATGCCKGKGGSMHLADLGAGIMGTSAIVATAIPHAVGYAYGLQVQKKEVLTCVFFGDGATEEGAFYESLNFAALKKTPVLFICENNGYAVHSKREARQAVLNIAEKVSAFGIPAQTLEGSDVSAVYGVAADAVSAIRGGKGPQFIEFMTYRWQEHVGPQQDYASGYRGIEEAQVWFDKDPLKNAARDLSPELCLKIENEIKEEIKEAFQFAEDSPLPDSEQLFTDLFSEARG